MPDININLPQQMTVNLNLNLSWPDLEAKMSKLTDDVQTLVDTINAENTVIDGAVALINGIATQLTDAQQAIADGASADQVIGELVTTVQAKQGELAAAVANVPGATPAPAPAPTEVPPAPTPVSASEATGGNV